ncbi:hypothetical protein acsn021_05920 [Anaerocolumna cellulosilytica]|uniref:Uncharacterized protein n=1 Tax=Anaerocolumna cellulosilytica TaxID=433286 RepID=A0A6S6QNU9_9FIRM|nr:carbohydrate-binding domain-containing protein [Anaerocolumna cellulosilytica]MBB5197765.1 hypothetical protein [Anaerocolumna cellulosilytica]BCJ93023.1 hypothetical protein acsn021_05920 [Anaerocolumna cellulosilytica]
MRKLNYFITALTITAMIAAGCSVQSGGTKSTTDIVTEAVDTELSGTSSVEKSTEEVSSLPTSLNTTSEVVIDTEFTARDLEVGYEESTAVFIALKDNATEIVGDGATVSDNSITISNEGTYVLSGTLSDGQIIVDVSDTKKIQLVLDNVTINSSLSAPLYIKSADKVFITLKEGSENILTDGTEYVQTDDNNVDGVIFSKADVTFNGSGTINITGNYKHGIVSKDDIVITGGTYNITAVKDAINGKDAVKIMDGIFNLSADTGNGIQSKNGDNTTKGYVYIAGGEINVIKCQEGIEGTVIIVEDGTINIIAADDGMNAASGSSDEATEKGTTTNRTNRLGQEGSNASAPAGGAPDGTAPGNGGGARENPSNFSGGFGGGMDEVDTNCYILITGGTITIDASGDGIDSNGNLYITGGILYIYGPTSNGDGALDYNGTADISGGTVLVAGSAGMAQGFSDTSTQYSLLYNLTSVSTAGTEINLTDAAGAIVASYTPVKEYQSIVISTPELTKDSTYTLTSGEQTAEITLTSVVTSNGQHRMGGSLGNRTAR